MFGLIARTAPTLPHARPGSNCRGALGVLAAVRANASAETMKRWGLRVGEGRQCAFAGEGWQDAEKASRCGVCRRRSLSRAFAHAVSDQFLALSAFRSG